jgi:hypothetical protein
MKVKVYINKGGLAGAVVRQPEQMAETNNLLLQFTDTSGTSSYSVSSPEADRLFSGETKTGLG